MLNCDSILKLFCSMQYYNIAIHVEMKIDKSIIGILLIYNFSLQHTMLHNYYNTLCQRTVVNLISVIPSQYNQCILHHNLRIIIIIYSTY